MSLFNQPLANVIRCDEPSYLIWKWRPEGAKLGQSKRENTIRWGSTLRVKEGSAAVFVNRQNGGMVQDFIEGPFDQTLKTSNLPGIASLIGLAFGGDSPFQAEVYFINLAQTVQMLFGVPYFDLFDPRFPDFGVPTAVRGTISFRISDYREFIKLHRLENFSVEDLQRQVRAAIAREVKPVVMGLPVSRSISAFQIESMVDAVSSACEQVVPQKLRALAGIETTAFDVSTIEIDRSSESYRQLKALTQDVTTATVQAETAAKVKTIHDQQRIEMENLEDSLRRQREESQYATHKQTQSGNFAAYQVEAQTTVGVSGAEALGKMGSTGGTSVNLGESSGMNMAGLVASMAMGGAIGQNLASTIGGAMQGSSAQTPVPTPPSLQTRAFYIAQGTTPLGPLPLEVLRQLRESGELTPQTLAWTQGMDQWVPAGSIPELKSLFSTKTQEPPPIPSGN